MNLLILGNTYDIKLIGSTATNGYEQIESFINFPNTIFQINSVATTYTAKPSPATDPVGGHPSCTPMAAAGKMTRICLLTDPVPEHR